MHSLLRQQIAKYLAPAVAEGPQQQDFLAAIDQAYQQADADRLQLQRSVEQSSAKLGQRNSDLQARLLELEKTQAKLARSSSLLRSTLDSTANALVVIGNDHKVRAHNRQFVKMLPNWAKDSCVGMATFPLLRPLLRAVQDVAEIKAMLRTIRRSPEQKIQRMLELKDGRFLEMTSIPQTQDGEIVGRVFTLQDVTDKRLDEETIRHQAYHDALTGLPNRLLMGDRLRHAISLANRTGRGLVLFFLDLDHFKSVNDRLGHDVGDQLLQEVAGRLKNRLRASDTICRLGGDEFTVMLEDLPKGDSWQNVATDLIERLSRPYLIAGQEIWISVSIGVSHHPRDAQTADELLRHADMAMYEAKQLGRNRYSEFSTLLQVETDRKAAIEAQLRHAIERNELHLEYQPKYALATLRPVGFEALLRWHNPVLGKVSPDEFIAVAEQCGLIVEIGHWVIEEACSQLRRWQVGGFSEMTIAVNLSTQQFKHPSLVVDIEKALQRNNLHPAWLELEITESSVMEDVEYVTGVLLKLRQFGVALSIDDFGSGYSSMSYLKNLPVDYLKVDRTFVQEIADCPEDTAIVASMITLGHNLGLKVVAEGVETQEGLECLARLNCDLVQGYLLSRPVSAEQATQLLHEQVQVHNVLNGADSNPS
ncbi:MAG: putative bifunctional diguanylate cyclase/phosphodiesterase [Pseudomonadales bacterium]